MDDQSDRALETRRRMKELYLSGETLAACCKILHIGQVVAMRYMELEGVQARRACRRGWSDDQIDLCVQMYKDGKTYAQIALAIGSNEASVGRAIHKRVERHHYYWSDERLQELISLYAQGHSMGACAIMMKTNRKTVRYHLTKVGVRIRPHEEATPRGEKSGNWKGGRVVGEYIYLKRPNHPYHTAGGYVLEHRLVMEKYLDRYLLPAEVVHHKNKNKHDNRLENLQLFASNAEHLAAELKGQCPKWSEDGRRRIEEAHRLWIETHTSCHPKNDAPL